MIDATKFNEHDLFYCASDLFYNMVDRFGTEFERFTYDNRIDIMMEIAKGNTNLAVNERLFHMARAASHLGKAMAELDQLRNLK